MPFKTGYNPGFGASKLSALRRFHQLERRFQENPTLQKGYSNCLKEYKKLRQMAEVDKKNTILDRPHHFFVPHHTVLSVMLQTKAGEHKRSLGKILLFAIKHLKRKITLDFPTQHNTHIQSTADGSWRVKTPTTFEERLYWKLQQQYSYVELYCTPKKRQQKQKKNKIDEGGKCESRTD